ncbi:MAG: hypothetical protein J7619_07500 [Dyadobacter sp.]|uniref:hypothetical protein n=1 Tax=Dyadobacter sp. TaxID=1914288 RepID=UPI001B257D80|nr:hypothetical protein [Dyadobacter sp.]MBO9612522.1 hypothetical protein [Dyadobacter sp.]
MDRQTFHLTSQDLIEVFKKLTEEGLLSEVSFKSIMPVQYYGEDLIKVIASGHPGAEAVFREVLDK